MMEEFFSAGNIDNLSTTAVLCVVAILVITGKLLWHKTVETAIQRERDRADRWETVALEALSAGAQAGVKAAEVAVEVVSTIPDPARERAGKG